MKTHKNLLILINVISALVIVSAGIYFTSDKYGLKQEAHKQAIQKSNMYKTMLDKKTAYLNEIQENEPEYKNYYELWKNEALVASNKGAWNSVISRIAADKDVLLRHIDNTESLSQNIELEVTGEFQALLAWLNACESHLYGLKVLKSRWSKDTDSNAKLYMEIQMYNPEITES